MAYCSVTYMDKNRKQMSTVPRVLVNGGTFYWPSNKKKAGIFYNNCEPPKSDWYQIHGATIIREGM